MVAGLTPKLAYADDRNADHDRPIRLRAVERFAPIGKIDGPSAALVDGRAIQGAQLIWGGELLQAPPDRSVRVSLDSIGQVTLYCGAIAKLGVTCGKGGDNINGSVLIASLIKGDVAVKLRDNAEAYVEASGSALTSSRGASFSVGVSENAPVVTTASGVVNVEQQTTARGNYMIRPVGNRAKIDVKLNKSLEAQFVVTDENDKPVPDVPVIIAAGGGATLGSGAATVTVTTNALGIASAPVTGTAVGSTSVTATIAGTNATATLGVGVGTAGVLGGTAIAAIAVAAGAGATAAVVTKKLNNKDEIKQTSEPKITPTSIR
jgi:hypothetical protein